MRPNTPCYLVRCANPKTNGTVVTAVKCVGQGLYSYPDGTQKLEESWMISPGVKTWKGGWSVTAPRFQLQPLLPDDPTDVVIEEVINELIKEH